MIQRSPILEVKNICKSFPGVKALDNVSLEVYPGECLALIGENGAGKSTLMKILSGAYEKDSGEIYFQGELLNIKNPAEASQKGIGIIYQELSLVRQFTAVENLFLGRWKKDKANTVDWKGMKREVKEFYNSIHLEFDLDVPVRELSIAQNQLIEITRAVFLNSKVIIMDEPSSSLTKNEVKILFRLIRDLKAKGVAVIYISHKLEELFEIGDRIHVMKDGCNAGEFKMDEVDRDKLVRAMVGRDLEKYYPEKTHTPSDKVVMEVKNINWRDRVKGVSFKVHAGEILGFSGLVGSGRTETMRAIFKAETDAKGQVFIDGEEVKIKSPADAIKAGIAFVTEDRRYQGLVLPLNIANNITLSNMKSFANKLGVLRLKKESEIAEKYKKSLNIRTPNIKKKVSELSGGNQQKVVIAKWMNTDVRVIIFDEPTRGIDVGAKAEIYQLMSDLAAEGAAIIMISSELPEILGVSDRVIVMYDGMIKGEFNIDEANEEKIMAAAIGGSN